MHNQSFRKTDIIESQDVTDLTAKPVSGTEAKTRPVAYGTRPGRSLTARILMLTVGFILIGEILIFIPSIARFRLVFLEERIAASHIAVLPAVMMDNYRPTPETAQKLLDHAGVMAITIRDPSARVMLGKEREVPALYDLRDATPFSLIAQAFETFRHGGERNVKIIDKAPMVPGTLVEVIISEAELWREMRDYGGRILTLTMALSVIVGMFIFFSLRWLVINPLRDLTSHIAAFRDQPENDLLDVPETERGDEIGVVQRSLKDMQIDVRQSLRQKTRLAGLGEAVSKISHDLRNILSSAVLISDRLEISADPQVQKMAPRLIDSLNRAIRLSNSTLEYARSGLPRLQLKPLPPADLLRTAASNALENQPTIALDVIDKTNTRLLGDQDQLTRAFENLMRNAVDAMPNGGRIAISIAKEARSLKITIDDTGTGIPDPIVHRLFEPFGATSKAYGSGLGLAITREILRAHGGDILLVSTDAAGTRFLITLPALDN